MVVIGQAYLSIELFFRYDFLVVVGRNGVCKGRMEGGRERGRESFGSVWYNIQSAGVGWRLGRYQAVFVTPVVLLSLQGRVDRRLTETNRYDYDFFCYAVTFPCGPICCSMYGMLCCDLVGRRNE